MKVWINLYRLKASPNIPYALAFKRKADAKDQKHPINDDWVFVKRIKAEI